MGTFDVAVIGSGSGGLTVAIGLSSRKKVVLIEKALIGGDCTNYGCIPSKALIDIAKGGKFKGTKAALKEARKRRQIIRDEESVNKLEKKYGIKVKYGTAKFKDRHTIIVGDEEIAFKYAVIASGSSPRTIPINGAENKDILTNKTIFEVDENINDLVIIGGGYIGSELGETFAKLGTNVTIIQRSPRLIPMEEPESSNLLQELLGKQGINIYTDSEALKAEKKKLTISHKQKKEQSKISYDKILIALGRIPNIQGMDLENAGIKYNEKGINTNKFNQTSSKNIYAIGDCVNGNPFFTHRANHEGRAVNRNILFPIIKTSVRNSPLPSTLYTSVEIARIGKIESQLRSIYGEDEIISKILYFKNNDRSIVTEQRDGFVKINFKRMSGKILSGSIMSSSAGEMLPILTQAIKNNISAYKLSDQIFAYPTKADLIKRVCDQFVIYTLSNIKQELKHFIKSNSLQIFTAILWILMIYFYFYFKMTYHLSNEEIAFRLYNFIKSYKYGGIMIGAVVYVIAYSIRPIILFPATFLTFMSGALFGPLRGFVYTSIGANLSAQVAYLLGRIFGKKIIKPEQSGIISDLKHRLENKSFLAILMTRLLFFPFDLVNYAAGILKANWKGFSLGTLIGIIPGSMVFVLVGASIYGKEIMDIDQFLDAIKDPDTAILWAAAILFLITIAIAKLLEKKESAESEKECN